MNFDHRNLLSIAAAATLLFAGTAGAQDSAPVAVPSPPPGEAARSVAPGEAVPLPDARQSEGGAAYVTGGAVYEQLPSFQRARSEYPLNIEIYEKAGSRNQFTADAQVKLLDRGGKLLLDARADGPYLWAKVPPGQYKVQTTLNGITKEQRVSVSNGRSTRAIFVFQPAPGESGERVSLR
ncbi:MAG TPA: hypothetical protein VFL64_08415 [Rhizobacter sp.]|nr:hypothetical protein [Rhizobacter sp.]